MSSSKANYFNQPTDGKQKEAPVIVNNGSHKLSQYATLITSTLSLISIIILLILNMTSLIKLYKDQNEPDVCKQYFQSIANTITHVDQDITADIKPKVNLIASSSSYVIPNMLSTIETNIINEIARSCDNDGNDTTQSCTSMNQVFHSLNFALINTDVTDQCIDDHGTIKVSDNTTFLNYPSFIPQATTPGGCIRIPSFSLSNTIFS